MATKNIEDVDLYAILDIPIGATESDVCIFFLKHIVLLCTSCTLHALHCHVKLKKYRFFALAYAEQHTKVSS